MRNAKGLATLGFVAALFALILTPMLFDAGSVRAQGAIPADLYGGGLAEGDVVVASIGDSECGSSTAERCNGGWFVRVYPGDCGGAAESGATITFTINGDPAAESITFEPGYAPDDAVNGDTLTVCRSRLRQWCRRLRQRRSRCPRQRLSRRRWQRPSRRPRQRPSRRRWQRLRQRPSRRRLRHPLLRR